MEKTTLLYSFVVPIYNDGYLVEDFCNEIQRVFQKYLGEENIEECVEVIFVNDGSKNNSYETICEVAGKFPFVRGLSLSRNFGQHIALSAGYRHARGQYVGMLNADMQDPPSEIPKMLEEMKSKSLDIVLGRRKFRKGSVFSRFSSKLFNWFLNKFSGYDLPLDVATLRIMNRKFLDAYNSLTEKSRFIPGLEAWLGFKRGCVFIEHQDRTKGKSSYNLSRKLKMAVESIISFSDLPLRMIAWAGIILAFLGFLMILIIIALKLFFIENYLPGYVSTISIILLVGGINILVIGVSSLYIGRILREVQGRPLYIISESINFENNELR